MMNTNTVLITGATSGFGLASARRFAEHGYSLIITGRRTERLQQLANELEPLVPVHVVTLDVRDASAVDRMVSELPDDFQNIEVLVNNAGLALGTEPAWEASLEDWQTMIDTNVTGLVNVTHKLLPLLRHQPKASIINLASVAASWSYPGASVYGGSKAFVAQFSRNLRSDLAGSGVRVTSLEPGMCETEFSVVRFKGDQERSDKLYAGVNPIRPEDIADMILWIAQQPVHININSLEVMPTTQAWDNFKVVREKS